MWAGTVPAMLGVTRKKRAPHGQHIGEGRIVPPVPTSFDSPIGGSYEDSMADETRKNPKDSSASSLSLWFVTVGTETEVVKARTRRSAREAVAATAEAIKLRYRTKRPAELRAGRVDR